MHRGGYGGLPQDDAEAKKWYGKAAAQGDTLAEFALVLEDWRIIAFIRNLPQGYMDAIFWVIIVLLILVPIGVCVLIVIFFVRLAKRVAQRKS